jgi:NADP-dependent 3-hydroxy acid dehydrogenase YdfG
MTKEQTAIVTGASSGIGRAVTHALAAQGINVLAAGRSSEKLAAVQAELAGRPGCVELFGGDVTEPDHTEQLLAAAKRKWGPASIFVASAGIGLPGTVLSSAPSRWNELIETNYLAILRQLRAAGSEFRMLAEKEGNRQVRDIVVIGSTAGRHISSSNPVYGSTKFAVHSLAEALRQEVCAHNIRVTLIEPGFVRSGFQDAAGYDMAWFETIAAENGPLLVPEDVASVVEFVVSRPMNVHVDNIRLRPTRQKG